MTGRYDRPVVKQITKQWVKENCKSVTDRDIGLLRLLTENKRRLLRRDQIEILYPHFASTDRLNKRLRTLFHMHLIDKVYPPVGIGEGTSKQHICLDRAGAILLDLEKFNKIIGPARSLPLGWEHKVMLNTYECSIVQFLRDIKGDMILYEVEEPHQYGDSKLIPDILCLFKHNNKGYVFFIEVDMGTEDIPYIKSKLESYKDYYISQQWVTKPWARMFKTPTFPRVLFLTEDNRPKRISSLSEYTEGSSIRFMHGTHNQLRVILDNIVKG
ncbi:hypothetical protein D1872_51970 [compost metagenome]